jgi:fructosamine-3-kinase
VRDWRHLGKTLAERLGLPAAEVRATPLGGGDINRAFRLDLGAERFFVKTNRADLLPMFDAESAGLAAMAATRTIRVPGVYMTGVHGGEAYIVMQFIELGGRPNAARLARELAAMHANVHRRFGFPGDNTIGSTPQPNGWLDDWLEFWRERRLGFQLRLAADKGFDRGLVDAGRRLADNLAPLFGDYRPRASLLHGDLWSCNLGADAEGNPVIYDPACYYGDHEADLAMMELFGHPGDEFFARYHECFPIHGGYAVRRDLYNLYHVLNHANLFGGGYYAQARRMIDRLLALT